MNAEMFSIELDNAFKRAKDVLDLKASFYSSDNDRLANFKAAAGAQSINPIQALVGMMTKHYVSVCDMSKDPTKYTIELWNEKLGDLRNYCLLCEVLIRDIGVE